MLAFYEKDLKVNFFVNSYYEQEEGKMSLQVKKNLIKSEQIMGPSHSWPNNLPGHIHKASAVVAVVVQAVLVYNPHTADLVLVGS